MIRHALVASLLVSCGLAACYGTPKTPRVAYLRVIAEPPSATVYVDGDYFGRARVLAQQPRALGTGKRLVTFEAPGYFPHDVELELAPGETVVHMQLLAIPP